ncbi:sugar ABC transporter permease [Paenibacillus montaniterrae]|uniref:Sugar ABC transporter permease n=1 Tax=Paenibacillus montaniterrae TaxID=429341 RepID=A0A919YKI1_9BACL|nr:sugar ABC transporter permease [Paenibacillus montaniterrae]GIP14875.1 sugar ABC transporter permease [Paenibacillus montaniterrae]
MNRRNKSLYSWAYLFMLPQLLMLAVFTIYPIVMSYVYSFYDWSGIGPLQQFIGWDNFYSVMTDRYFWNAYRNNLIYIGFTVLITLPAALLAALLLNLAYFKGKVVYRTLLFLPVVTTTAIVGVVLKSMFGTDNAIVNLVLQQFNLIKEPIGWLSGPYTSMLVLIGAGIWKVFGMIMIYWLAGLQSLPKEIYEAARIDGAGWWAALRYITIPLLLPVSAVILLLTVMNGIHVFDLVTTLTGGGPFFATDMVDLYIYRYAFGTGGFPQQGYASAAGIIFGMSIFVISLVLGAIVQLAMRRQRSIAIGKE